MIKILNTCSIFEGYIKFFFLLVVPYFTNGSATIVGVFKIECINFQVFDIATTDLNSAHAHRLRNTSGSKADL